MTTSLAGQKTSNVIENRKTTQKQHGTAKATVSKAFAWEIYSSLAGLSARWHDSVFHILLSTHGQVSTALLLKSLRNYPPARCSSSVLLCTQIQFVSDVSPPGYKPGTAAAHPRPGLGRNTWICFLSVSFFPSLVGESFHSRPIRIWSV